MLEVEALRCIMVDSARGGWQGVLDLTVGHPGSGYLLMQVCWPCLVTSFGYSISLALFLFLAVSSKAAAGCHSVGGLLRLFMIVSCCLTNSSLLIYSFLYRDSNEFCCAGAMVFC